MSKDLKEILQNQVALMERILEEKEEEADLLQDKLDEIRFKCSFISDDLEKIKEFLDRDNNV